jgi:nicotinate phosphoribosyltransferase
MDTPGNRRGDFLDLMREVRWELDRNGFEHVKIFASGGIDVEYILHLNPVCDAYGVGGAIADAPMIDYSLDLVEVNGEDRSKRGKRGGRKPLRELYSYPPDMVALRQRVLDQLGTGEFDL